ncbi:MAG TPA: MarR family transcriptional regulator, partial [Dehalococcoidia bacterium]|nr:MarR family transcriptional regulator [Dehalococcoidia bacterium]
TARTLTRLYERELRPHGLRATQFSILASLGIRGATKVGEIARGLDLERTTVTRSAALLERNGWIRHFPAKDGREHPLELTPAGRQKLETALPAWKRAQEAAGREFARSGMTANQPGILPRIDENRGSARNGGGGETARE